MVQVNPTQIRTLTHSKLSESKAIKAVAVALAIGALCASLGGCISDTGAPVTRISQDTPDHAPLRYYGGPKSPMW